MKINKISFITPYEKITEEKISLEKVYSQEFTLNDNSTISIASNIGKRSIQQDCIAITKNHDYTLLLISDGIGGGELGEKASYIAAEIIKKWIDAEDPELLKTLTAKTLEDALNALMYLISTNIPEMSGATLNLSIIGPVETLIANVGDSRTYSIKEGKINLLTNDDSLVFKRFNPLTSSERDKLRFHKENNIIINSISKNAFPTIKIKSIKNQDYDILCHVTDGISDYLPEESILLYCQKTKPAKYLTTKSTNGNPIYNYDRQPYEKNIIYPGEDNASAIVYTKKRIKSS